MTLLDVVIINLDHLHAENLEMAVGLGAVKL